MIRPSPRLIRFLLNGVVATAVHYAALSFYLEVLQLKSAGLSNLLAAPVGIAASFLGNRYYVFRRSDSALLQQALKFVGLYAALAVLHGSLLYVWTDQWELDYRIGFLIAVGAQVVLGYLAGKYLVFGVRPIETNA